MNITAQLRKTVPPVYFLTALLLMITLAHLVPIANLVYVPLRVFGGVAILAGLVLTTTGARTFKWADTPIRPFEQATTLVTVGIYRHTRNPMYLGMLIMLGGTWAVLGKLSPLFVIPIFFFVIREGFVKAEEEFLEKNFGKEYREYSASVRRWL